MQRLAPDLVRFPGWPIAIHVVTAEPVTLIDAGAPGQGRSIERRLRAVGVHPRRIVLTHGDPDHAGAADHLRAAFDAEVVAAAAERPMLDRTAWPELPLVRRLLMRSYFRNAPPPTIDRWLAADGELDGIRVIATPGHTPGHLAFAWDGWVLAGDALVSGARPRESLSFLTLDRARARHSIEALAALDLPSISSSHGKPGHGGDALRRLVDRWRGTRSG